MLHNYLFRKLGLMAFIPLLIMACTATQTGTSDDTTVTEMTKPAVDTPLEPGEEVSVIEETSVEAASPREGGIALTETGEEISEDPDMAESALAPEISGEPIPGTTIISQGLYLQYDDPAPQFFVIADEPAWVDFWQTYTPDGQGTIPTVDFNTSFVLVGIQGAKSTGGYQIAITHLDQRGDEVHVLVDLVEPVADEPADMEFTQPYVIVQVEIGRLSSTGPLTFIFETDEGQELGRITQTIPSL